MKELVKRLQKWEDGGEAPPLIAQLHLTNMCNLSCDFCPTVASKQKGEMNLDNELDKETWKRIIDQGNKLGIKEWHICGGGEPLFDRNLALEVMEKMKENNGRGEIITNGTLLDKKAVDKIIEINWDLVTFSLDGPDALTNDSIRSEGSFKQALANAKYLSSAKKDEKPYLVIHTVLCNKNYDKTPEMVKLVDEIGFDEIRFNSMNIWNEAGQELKLDQARKKDARKNLIAARKISNELNIKTNINEFIEHNLLEHSNQINKALKKDPTVANNNFSELACYYPWYNISIFSDGRAAPCFLFHDGITIKDKPLETVWKSSYFQDIRSTFIQNELKKECKNCNAWNVEKMEKIRKNLSKE